MRSPFVAIALVLMTVLVLGPARGQIPNTLHDTLLSPSTRPQGVVQFGQSVAIDGGFMVVGAPFTDDTELDSGQAYVYDTATGALVHTLKNPSPSGGEEFAYAVAISGHKVVVGAHKENSKFSVGGAVYVFDLDSPTPTVPTATILNPLSFGGQANFGRSVAISGNRVVVGAHGVNGFATGAAYLFDLSSATPAVPLQTFAAESSGDGFGTSVAIDGTRVVIGAILNNTGAADAGSAYVYDVGGPTPTTPVLTLRNPAPAATDYFGYAVSVIGSRIAVGAPLDDAGGIDAGSVYIYDASTATPTVPLFTLAHPTPSPADFFGIAVSLSGTKALVGCSSDDVGANPDAGTAFLFDLASGSPTVPALTFVNPTPTGGGTGDSYGFTVALSGSRALVGAYLDDIPGASNAGAAYLYETSGPNPTVPARTLQSSAIKTNDLFGFAVAVSGVHAVVSAKDDVSTDSGRLYVFDTSSLTPAVPTTTLEVVSGSSSFGFCVAMSGSRVVVGAPLHSSPGTGNNGGVVYVFDLSSPTPGTPVFTLTNPAPESTDQFGYAVGISDTRVVVGAPFDDASAANCGTAYVFDLAGATPNTAIAVLPNPSPAAEDNFGKAVGIDGTRVLVSAPGDDTTITDSGAAYFFELTSATPTVPTRTLDNPTPGASDFFGSALAIEGTRMIVGAYQDDTTATNAGTVYVYDTASGSVPIATLANPAPAADDFFGFAVALSGGIAVIGASQDDATATDAGTIYVYQVGGATPTAVLATLANPTPAAGDKFGSSVAISGAIGLFGAPNDDTINRNKGAAYVFGLERPEITVEQPVLSNFLDNGTKGFGVVRVGDTASLTFLLKNTGTSDLSGIAVTKNGTDAAQFTFSPVPPALLGPGASTSLIVQFAPASSGNKTAALHIASNDFDENPFDINLTGAALSNTEDTDADGMNDWAEFLLTPQGFNYQLAQPALVSQFYAGANASGLYTPSQLQAMHVTPLLQRNATTGVFKVVIGLEKSADLQTFLPFPMTVPQVTINAQGQLEFQFSVPGNAEFFRIDTQ